MAERAPWRLFQCNGYNRHTFLPPPQNVMATVSVSLTLTLTRSCQPFGCAQDTISNTECANKIRHKDLRWYMTLSVDDQIRLFR